MKLLSKLSTLIKAVTRGPAVQPPSKARVPPPDALPSVQVSPEASSVEQEPALESGRVADLLQRKLTSPDTGSQQSEKGD